MARRLLADKLDEMENGAKSRLGIKAEVKRKRKASGKKKARRKYRRLEEGKLGLVGQGKDGDGDADGDADFGDDDGDADGADARRGKVLRADERGIGRDGDN